MSQETISVVTDDTNQSPNADTRSWETVPGTPARGKVEISVEKLEQEMACFLLVIGRLFNRAEEVYKKPGIKLNEIELSIEISGEGKISLIGTGAKASSKGAITLKFKREDFP